MLFAGTDADFNTNLWVTNGTAGGTSELSVPAAGPNPDLEPDNFFVFGSEALFTGNDASFRSALWVTNGTGAGTSELSVAGASSGGLLPFGFVAFGSKVLFSGNDANHHRELWITNGTAAGTSELSVAGAFSEGLNPGNFVVFGSEVLFQGHGADGAANLWVTNGTVAGTSEIFSAYVPSLTPGPFVFFTPTSAGAVPSVSAVLSPDAGEDFKAGGVVTIGLLMNEPVKVTGTPKLLLNDGGFASYTSGSNSDLLTFTYKVLAGQNTSSGAALQITSASLNGGTIKMSGGTAAADLSAAAGVNLGVIIDTTVPTVSSISAAPTSGGTVGLGGTVAIELQLSEAVVVSGTPTLKLSDGGTAVYVSGGSSNPASGSLEFDYTVGSGQNTPDLTISSLSLLGGASITDSAGNAVNPTLPASKNLHLTIDSIRPSVTSATATPGRVSNGGTAIITLKLSEAVTRERRYARARSQRRRQRDLCQWRRHDLADVRYVVGGETAADLRLPASRTPARSPARRATRRRPACRSTSRWGQRRFLENRQERQLRRRLQLDLERAAGAPARKRSSASPAPIRSASHPRRRLRRSASATRARRSRLPAEQPSVQRAGLVSTPTSAPSWCIAARPSRPAVSSQIPALSLPRAAASSSAAAPLAIPQRARSQRPAAGSLN